MIDATLSGSLTVPIFDGMDEVCDRWLGLGPNDAGQPPRFRHLANLQALANRGPFTSDGQDLIASLWALAIRNWDGLPSQGQQNWRHEEQLNLNPENPSPEVALERTIARITDENWSNQMPVANGVANTIGRHAIDLVHREGGAFSLIELKAGPNADTPLSAAIQLMQYGAVYLFSRLYAMELGYDPVARPCLGASRIHFRVLAPAQNFDLPDQILNFLLGLHHQLSLGVSQFVSKVAKIEADFAFERFPPDFVWTPEHHLEVSVRRDLLWALHRRERLVPAETGYAWQAKNLG